MEIRKVAVLGLGRMGSRMASRLLGRDWKVTVWNRSPDKMSALVAQGAESAGSARDAVADCDLVITMLENGPVVEEVVFGGEIAMAMNAGAILIDMSSIPPVTARDHGKRLNSLGLKYLDAPVSGGTKGAEEGTLAILCGGSSENVALAKPVLSLLGNPTHVGPNGSGQLAKLCNQVIVAISIGAVSEALLLAAAGGADPAAVCEALQGGFADSRILREHGKRMLDRQWVPGGSSVHQLKDLDAVQTIAGDLGMQLPLLGQTRALFQQLQDDGKGAYDHAALLLELERLNQPHRVGEQVDHCP